jgi:general secretion pathway protein F
MPDPHEKPSDSPAGGLPLSPREAVEFTARLAELSRAGLPLAPGLRAAAAELKSLSRLAAAMNRTAADLERGASLEQALTAQRANLPADFAALVTAGIRAGELGRVLSDYARLNQFLDDARRKVRVAIAYNGFLVLAAAAVCLFLFVVVIPAMASLGRTIASHEIGASAKIVPALRSGIEASEWIAQHTRELLMAIAAIVIVAVLTMVVIGPRWRQRTVKWLPLFGPLWTYRGLIEATELLKTLLENAVPLGESLRLTAAGVRDADVGGALRQVADRVDSGDALSSAVASVPQFPTYWRPILDWGEKHSTLPAALEALTQATMRRLDQRADLIAAIVPPAVLLFVVAVVLFAMSFLGQLLQLVIGWSSFTPVSSSSGAPPAEWPVPSLAGAASLLLVGCAILVALRLVYWDRRPLADGLHVVIRLAGWLLIALGVFGVLMVIADGWAWLVWLAALVCWGIAVFRWRESQRGALLDLIALCAARGIPLEPAVRAMAVEEGGLFGSRAMPLADALGRGIALAPAVEQSRRALPPASALAARVGEVTGDMARALSTVERRSNRLEAVGGNPPIRAMSLVYTMIVAGSVAPFMAIRIAPAMEKIYKDFRRPLPPLSRHVFEMAGSTWLAVFSGVMLVVALATGLYAVVRGLGWMRFELPPASWLFAPREAGVVLRLLALAVERGQPIGPLLEYLSREYPSALMRKRARAAAVDVARGGDWAESLREAKLVRRSDAAILAAAAKTGNLAWALRETAAHAERRLNYRMSMVARIALPLLILLAGAAVMAFIVGYFLPLIELIGGLAKPEGK